MSTKPVIFLAFANDRVDHAAYLRNLPIELDGIRTALQKAVKANLCEVVERSNATIQHILDVFQDEYYKDRIAIFHYGGHANGYQLLLENLDGSHASAHSEGLVSFFAKQQGLQLIFLNGCSSQQQSLDLVNAGISAVIGTSQSINDDVATNLAIRFYKGLASGKAIDRSWLEAIDEVKITKGTANMRDLFWDGMEDMSNSPDTDSSTDAKNFSLQQDRFPWEMYYKEGAEIIKKWNLPEAVDNPLFGLPEVPKRDLPESPYRFLERYKREHAEIFFGRSYFIRELFNRATDPNAAPIILFYGQSGVGKSSMLDAGLFPRLEQVCNVIYLRRDAQKGLLGTMAEGLGTKVQAFQQEQTFSEREQLQAEINQLNDFAEQASGEKLAKYQTLISSAKQELDVLLQQSDQAPNIPTTIKSLAEVWKAHEARLGKPLVILLDQVEEIYTKPNPDNPNEITQAMQEVHALFANPQDRPQGKLILSYRKEYHPEIEEAFKKLQLPREHVFLRKLEKRDIREVVMGLMTNERLQKRYNLTVEKDLDAIIADDLIEDKDSPIAPVLQILLTKMWKLSEQEELRYFSIKKYQQLKRQGILMDDFFHEQMEYLRRYYPDLEASGLALDVLYFHTTKLGTANSHSLEELRERYGERQYEIDKLIGEFKNLYLLADAGVQSTGLAHDTLAPIVQDEFRHSAKPGQRAALILENKAIAFEQDPNTVLDLDDLRLVEEGGNGMRIWTKKEEELIEKSRKRKTAIIAEKKRNKRIRNGGVLVIACISVIASVLGVFSYYQNQVAQEKTILAQIKSDLAEEKSALAVAKTKETTKALESLEAKKLELESALVDAKAAKDTAEIERLNALSQKNKADIAKLEAIEKRLQAEALQLAGQSKEWYAKDDIPRALSLALLAEQKGRESQGSTPTPVYQALFDAYYYGFGDDNKQVIHKKVMRGHEKPVTNIQLAKGGARMVSVSFDYDRGYGETILWDGKGNFITKLPQELNIETNPQVIRLKIAQNGKQLLALAKGGKGVFLIDDQGKTLEQLTASNYIADFDFIPNTSNFYVMQSPGTGEDSTGFYVVDQNGELLKQITDQSNITKVYFQEDKKQVVTISNSQLVIRNSSSFAPIRSTNLKTATGKPTYLSFANNSKLLINYKDIHHLYDLNTGEFEFATSQAPSSIQAIPTSPYIYSNYAIWNMEDSMYKVAEWKSLPDYNYTDISSSTGMIATAGEGGEIQLRNSEGKLIKETKVNNARISDLKFTPDGRYFVTTGSEDYAISLWDLSLNKVQEFKGHTGFVYTLDFTPDGKQLITTSSDKTSILWDLPRKKGSNETVKHGNGSSTYFLPKPIEFSEDGKQFMTSSYTSVIIWNTKTLEKTFQYTVKNTETKNLIASTHFSKDGSRIFIHLEDSIGLLYASSGKLLKTFPKYPFIKHVSFSSTTKQLAISTRKYKTGDGDNIVHSKLTLFDWNGKNGREIASSTYAYRDLSFSPDGRYLFVKIAGENRTLENGQHVVIDATNGKTLTTLVQSPPQTFTPQFAKNGKVTAILNSDMTVQLWEMGTWKKLANIVARKYHAGDPSGFHISANGEWLLTSSKAAKTNQALVLWDGSGNQISTIKEVNSEAKNLDFSPDGQFFIASWDYGYTLGLWDLKGTLVSKWKLPKTVASAKFTPDEQYIIVLDEKGTIQKLATIQGILANVTKNKRYQLSVAEKLALGLDVQKTDATSLKNPFAKLEVARALMKQGNKEEARQLYDELVLITTDAELITNIFTDYNRYQWPLVIAPALRSTDETLLWECGDYLLQVNNKKAIKFYEELVYLNPSLANVWQLQKAYKQFNRSTSPSKFLADIKMSDKNDLIYYANDFFTFEKQIQEIEFKPGSTSLFGYKYSLSDADAKTIWEYGLHYGKQLLAHPDLQANEKLWALYWSTTLNDKLFLIEESIAKQTRFAEEGLKLDQQLFEIKLEDYKGRILYSYTRLALLRIKPSSFEKSKALIEKAFAIDSTDRNVTRVQAHIYIAQGNFEKAKPLYLKALKSTKATFPNLKRQCLQEIKTLEKQGISKANTQKVKDLLEEIKTE